MSSTILDKVSDPLTVGAEDATGAGAGDGVGVEVGAEVEIGAGGGGDIMSNLKEKAVGMLTSIGRKSTEFLAFDHILSNKKTEPEKRQSLPLSEDELINFGEDAVIEEVTAENAKVGRSFSFSLNDSKSRHQQGI